MPFDGNDACIGGNVESVHYSPRVKSGTWQRPYHWDTIRVQLSCHVIDRYSELQPYNNRQASSLLLVHCKVIILEQVVNQWIKEAHSTVANNEQRGAQLSLRDRATRPASWNLVNCCTNVDDLHLKSPETNEWPSSSFKVTRHVCSLILVHISKF